MSLNDIAFTENPHPAAHSAGFPGKILNIGIVGLGLNSFLRPFIPLGDEKGSIGSEMISKHIDPADPGGCAQTGQQLLYVPVL